MSPAPDFRFTDGDATDDVIRMAFKGPCERCGGERFIAAPDPQATDLRETQRKPCPDCIGQVIQINETGNYIVTNDLEALAIAIREERLARVASSNLKLADLGHILEQRMSRPEVIHNERPAHGVYCANGCKTRILYCDGCKGSWCEGCGETHKALARALDIPYRESDNPTPSMFSTRSQMSQAAANRRDRLKRERTPEEKEAKRARRKARKAKKKGRRR